MVILISLLATLVALSIALAIVGITLTRRLRVLRDLQVQHEQVGNALTLLTEATESGFRWTASELQRPASPGRRRTVRTLRSLPPAIGEHKCSPGVPTLPNQSIFSQRWPSLPCPAKGVGPRAQHISPRHSTSPR